MTENQWTALLALAVGYAVLEGLRRLPRYLRARLPEGRVKRALLTRLF